MAESGSKSVIEDVEQTAAVYNINRAVPDYLRDKSQRYCVLSIVAPEGCNQKHKELAMQVYGCRESKADANRWARELRDSNPMFDVFVMDTCAWAALPPRLEVVDEVFSNDERVQAIYEQFKEEQVQRKADMVQRLDAAHTPQQKKQKK